MSAATRRGVVWAERLGVASGCVASLCVYPALYITRATGTLDSTPTDPRRRRGGIRRGVFGEPAPSQAEQVVVAEILPWAGRHVTTSPRPPPTLQQHGPTHLYESRCNARQSGTHAHPNATCGFSADVTVHACKSALQSRGYLSRKPAISPALGRFSCRPILCCTGGPIALHSCG